MLDLSENEMITIQAQGLLHVFEESANWALFSSVCDDISNLHCIQVIILHKGDEIESNSKFYKRKSISRNSTHPQS